MKTKETTHSPSGQGGADVARGRLQGGKQHKNKKGPGGRRNPLIRLDSAKEIGGFSLLYFGQALLDEVRIWLDLDLAWERFGFNYRAQLYETDSASAVRVRSRASMSPSAWIG